MRSFHRHSNAALALTALLAAPALHAQSAVVRPPIRQLSAALGATKDSLGNISNIRALPGGRVLVNDASSRRVLLLDSTMTIIGVVADSTPSTSNAYGPRSGSLVAYRGDSTLFIDAASLSMLVIDPNGKLTSRVMSIPRTQDAMMLSLGGLGGAYYDGKGKLVYRGMPELRMGGARAAGAAAGSGGAGQTMIVMGGGGGAAMGGGAGGAPTSIQTPDSIAIVRVDMATRALDTAGFAKIPSTRPIINRSDDGRMTITMEVNPLPSVDEWVVTSDGRIAFVRGKDYHVDFVNPDGSKVSAPKVAFDWKRLSDDDKVRFIDSVKAARDRMVAAQPNNPGAALGAAMGAAMGGAPAPMRFEMRVQGGPGGAGPAAGGAPPQMSAPQINFVSPDQLPDYQPPFFANSVRADADGNIWVRTIPTAPIAGGPVYDVIDRNGAVVERVQMPVGRTLVGFGPGGVAYLSAFENGRTKLERVRITK